MADSSSVDLILDFLQRNKFTRAEAALRSELSNHPDTNGFIRKLTVEEKDSVKLLREEDGDKTDVENQGTSSQNSEVSRELIVTEIGCGTVRNGSKTNWKSAGPFADRNKLIESVGTTEKHLAFSKDLEDSVIDLCLWKLNPSNGLVDPCQIDSDTITNNFSEFQVSEQLRVHSPDSSDKGKAKVKSREETKFSAEKRTSWLGTDVKANVECKHERNEISELKELDQQHKISGTHSKDDFVDKPWSRTDAPAHSSSDLWEDCSVKTIFPFSKGNMSTTYDTACGSGDKKEGKRKTETSDNTAASKEQVDHVGRPLYFGNTLGSYECNRTSSLEFPVVSENQKEDLPRLARVKLKLEDKSININWDEKLEHDGSGLKLTNADNTFLMGSFLDVPVGQEINSEGGRRTGGGSWLSVSQGIVEDTSDLVSGFATIGDGLSESVEYLNEYWDSDEYDDDDDVGYMRQPIEDETWFLAHEIDYPSDNEKGTGNGSVPDLQERCPTKDEDNDQSFAEEDSYFSGERHFQSKNVNPVAASDESVNKIYRRTNENNLIAQSNGKLINEEELNSMRAEPVWHGFVSQTDELIMLGDGKVLNECRRPQLDDVYVDDDQHGSVRSIGVGINSDAADIGSEVRESLVGGGSVGDLEYFHDNDVGIVGSRHSNYDSDKKYYDMSNMDRKRTKKHDSDKYVAGNDKDAHTQSKDHTDGGFLFPPPRDGQLVQTGSDNSLCSNKCNAVFRKETGDCLNTLMETDDMVSSWRRKSSDYSLVQCSRDENNADAVGSANSNLSLTNYGYAESDHVKKKEVEKSVGAREENPGVLLEDEEAAAVQEQIKQIKAQEEEFETFDLKIVHRKNRTGFEEDKNFHVVLNSVIAGRYHVTEYLGSAAFSKAIQAHDLHTGMDVCVKIIKNNKDFFDQSLDEIKLLKFINKHDPADKFHLLRLYDYFYYREHLLIVCELLKANLYEFHKFNRESGGEVYFTMPRLQSITIQCLEALQFLHGLGLIHCDLKPENILVKSYSRCEVKVIDLGSSCFQTDHLCSYVQSRSYRAPEVILGLPYDKKIDIWSLGCILAELCTGNVLFQNDSPATLLARIIGIIGSIDQDMLAKGRDTYKYFTKNHMLYERNQETNKLEYLIPKKSSLRHRLPMGDQGFIDFAVHLLEINPENRPSAAEALKHPWLSYPYEPISS
ncbi:uncharacterized protein LOC132285968 isoform X2 [Cornus florida]|uniref:uncharacterized protein LOC132285968 isoform X2 n=1 Tax=Cornus florida TaxID=4283 RepID=UPI00289A9DE9|nr:uncharacterized protein LOC132285968 isoform X2 [Cornus florida]